MLRPARHLIAVLAIGAAPVAGALAQSGNIVIGQTIAMTGGTAEHGNAVVLGARAYIDRINAAGGVNGRRVVLRTLDDAGDSGKAAENTRLLIERDNVIAVFGGIEGGPCVASLKVAVAEKVPLVGCMAGAPELRDPFNRYVFPIRAPHLAEFARLIDMSVQFGGKRIGFVHADSDTGRKHLENVNKLMARHAIPLTAAIVIPAKPDAAKVVDQIQDARLDMVFNHGSYSFYAQVIREARKRGLDTQFMAVNSGAQQLVRLLGPDAKGLVFTQVVPFPWGATPTLVRDYKEALKTTAPPPAAYSFSSLEGYLSAKVLVEGLRRMGPKGSREDLVAALESLGSYDAGGLGVVYTKSSRDGSTFVDTVIATTDGRFVR
jgi:ABC-type branched-subunit amino acid transport system substrate-binding protein